MTSEENKPWARGQDLEARLGRTLTDQERGLLDVLNTVLTQESRSSAAQGSERPASEATPARAGLAEEAAVRRLLKSLRAATEIAEGLAASDAPTGVQVQSVLTRLTPHLQAIALAANDLIDQSLQE